MKRGKGDSGVSLAIVMAYIVVIGLVVGGLTNWIRNDLNNSVHFANARSEQYALNGAMNIAIQSIRYTPLVSAGQTLNATPPNYCWGTSSPSTVSDVNNEPISVWCSTVLNATSTSTRVVSLYACPATVTATACATYPELESVVTFDDYPTPQGPPSNTACSTSCGYQMQVDSWVWKSPSGLAPNSPSNVVASSPSYTTAVNALSPSSYWPMSDSPGTTTINDASGSGNTGSVSGPLVLGSSGPPATLNAISFPGSTGSYVSTLTSYTNPQPLSMSAWFKTTGSGVIMGFSNAQFYTSTPTNFDRILWVDPTGHLVGGIYNNSIGATEEAVSSNIVNDGAWHQAVFTFGSTGEQLYVDGALVGSNSAGTAAQSYSGYWSIGYQDTVNWPDPPSSNYFTGSLAGVGVIPSVITQSQVQSLYAVAQSDTNTAVINWTAPQSNGSGAVTGYIVTATDTTTSSHGGQSCTISSFTTTTCTLTGLTAGDTYTFAVTDQGLSGTSAASVSNPLTIP